MVYDTDTTDGTSVKQVLCQYQDKSMIREMKRRLVTESYGIVRDETSTSPNPHRLLHLLHPHKQLFRLQAVEVMLKVIA